MNRLCRIISKQSLGWRREHETITAEHLLDSHPLVVNRNPALNIRIRFKPILNFQSRGDTTFMGISSQKSAIA